MSVYLERSNPKMCAHISTGKKQTHTQIYGHEPRVVTLLAVIDVNEEERGVIRQKREKERESTLFTGSHLHLGWEAFLRREVLHFE